MKKEKWNKLTKREREVYDYLVHTTMSYKEIAKEMILAPATVYTHVKTIFNKTVVSSRLELVIKHYKRF